MLYMLLVNRRYKAVLAILNERKNPNKYERCIYCLLYAVLGKTGRFAEMSSTLHGKRLSKEEQLIMAEANLMAAVTQKSPPHTLEVQAKEILEKKKASPFALSTLGQILFMHGQSKDAMDKFKMIFKLYPEALWVNKLIAYHLLKARKYKESLGYIRKIPNWVQRVIYSLTAWILLPYKIPVYFGIAILMFIVPIDVALILTLIFNVSFSALAVYLKSLNDPFGAGEMTSLVMVTTFAYLGSLAVNSLVS